MYPVKFDRGGGSQHVPGFLHVRSALLFLATDVHQGDSGRFDAEDVFRVDRTHHAVLGEVVGALVRCWAPTSTITIRPAKVGIGTTMPGLWTPGRRRMNIEAAVTQAPVLPAEIQASIRWLSSVFWEASSASRTIELSRFSAHGFHRGVIHGDDFPSVENFDLVG